MILDLCVKMVRYYQVGVLWVLGLILFGTVLGEEVSKVDNNYLNNIKNINENEINHIIKSEKYCDNYLSCLNLELYLNVSNIINKDLYKLSDRMFLEKYERGNKSDILMDVSMLRKNGVTTSMLLKKVMLLLKTHALKYNVLKGLDVAVFREEVDGKPKMAVGLLTEEPARDGRTFGVAVFRKRMMYILLAMTFKLGIMTTLLITLLVLTLKGLKIGVLLLVLSFGTFLAKWKYGHNGGGPHWRKDDDHDGKNIHIHVHGDKEAGNKQAYSGWAPQEQEYHPVHPAWRPAGVTAFHRRKNGHVYPVKEDISMGYPVVIKPPVYPVGYYQSRNDVLPNAGYNMYGVEDSQDLEFGKRGVVGPSSQDQESGYPEGYTRNNVKEYYRSIPSHYKGKGYQIEESDIEDDQYSHNV